MKSLRLAVLYGILIWIVVFAVSFAIFPIHDSNRLLFESIMPVAVVASVVLFSILYFRRLDKGFLNEGIKLGLLWVITNIVIDLPLFLLEGSPMKVTLAEYLFDIGVTYLMIPVITIGMGFLLEKRKSI